LIIVTTFFIMSSTTSTTSDPRLAGNFEFVRIPADSLASIELLSAPKVGGLSDDALLKYAKNHFSTDSSSQARYANSMAHASPEERQKHINELRQNWNLPVDKYDDDTLLKLVTASQNNNNNCDILALTVPTAANNYQAVSMYKMAAEDSSNALPYNDRATALVAATGHHVADKPVYGDVFVGRAHDDEHADVWVRMDFTQADADPHADWCRVARSSGGGGGSGNSSVSSLSRMVQQQGTGNVQVLGDSASLSAAGGEDVKAPSFGMNGDVPVQEQGYSWTQDADEVEVKFPVPPDTSVKDIQMRVKRSSVQVSAAGQSLLQGTLFLPVVPDECTYTLTQEPNVPTKDLTVTLTKDEAHKVWTFVVQ
jgi:hypothetical protein